MCCCWFWCCGGGGWSSCILGGAPLALMVAAVLAGEGCAEAELEWDEPLAVAFPGARPARMGV